MKSFGKARNDALVWARKQIGTKEKPAGSNKQPYGKLYGWDGVYWCAQFTWASAWQTGSGGGILKSASVWYVYSWAKKVGRVYKTPQAGDLAIWKGYAHIELVESYSNGRLIDIGGNTSDGTGGSVSNGGGVFRNNRTKTWKSGKIIGFVRPLYGITFQEMQTIQTKLGLKADGVFGPATKAAVKTFQSKNGLSADGFPGPATYAKITGSKVAAEPVKTTPTAAKKSGPSKLAEDGVFGVESAKELQRRLGVTADGKIGPDTIKAWQKHEGTKVDGKISGQKSAIFKAFPSIRTDCIETGGGGSSLIAKVQKNTGQHDDGYAGNDTARAMQRAMNTNPNAFK